jgi:hypothetical protein
MQRVIEARLLINNAGEPAPYLVGQLEALENYWEDPPHIDLTPGLAIRRWIQPGQGRQTRG